MFEDLITDKPRILHVVGYNAWEHLGFSISVVGITFVAIKGLSIALMGFTEGSAVLDSQALASYKPKFHHIAL